MKWEKLIIAFVSAVFAAILYVLLPLETGKYRLILVEEMNFNQLLKLLHADLDGDNAAEIIRVKDAGPVPAIVVQRADYRIVDQWNLNGQWVDESDITISDFDHDGFKEITAFTYYHDSIWIHVLEPLQPGGIIIHKAIDHVRLYNGNQDWKISVAKPFDLTGDTYDDCLFVIRSGFTIQPRRLYLFDLSTERIIRRSEEYGNVIFHPVVMDFEGDGQLEITGNMSATGNTVGMGVAFPDSCSWLMVLNHHLQLIAQPRSYLGKPSYVRVLPVMMQERQLLVSDHFAIREGGHNNLLELWGWEDDSLRLIRSAYLEKEDQARFLRADARGEGYFYMLQGGTVVMLNLDLEEVKRIELGIPGKWMSHFSKDMDGDGTDEQLFYTKNGQLLITRNNFSSPVSLDLGNHLQSPVISEFTRNGKQFVNVFRRPQNLVLEYKLNPWYSLRYLIILLSFVAYYLIFSIINKVQRKRIERQRSLEKTVLSYQLSNVMQQLDPHFLFNALSNISSYYHMGKKDYAQDYLAKISKLIRSSLENSEKMTISLSEELSFVRDYLYVEGIRMGERFDFSIDVDKEIFQHVQVPKMLIQNFVENAMKHGIRHLKDRKGLIRIYGSEMDEYFQIFVEDNGIGRKRAGELGSFGTGNGLKMVQNSLDIFEKLYKTRISFDLEDLKDQDEAPIGTRVSIRIPKKK